MKIIVHPEGNGYLAHIEGRPEIYGYGTTRDGAIGAMVRKFGGVFGFTIEDI